MSTEDVTAEIAAVLAEHAKTERFTKSARRGIVTWGVRCICGHEIEWGADETSHHRNHLADLLAARDRRVRAEALREAAERLPALTEGTDRAGISTFLPHDRDIYSLAVEESAAALRTLATFEADA